MKYVLATAIALTMTAAVPAYSFGLVKPQAPVEVSVVKKPEVKTPEEKAPEVKTPDTKKKKRNVKPKKPVLPPPAVKGSFLDLQSTTGAMCRTRTWYQCRRYIATGVVRCGNWYRSYRCS